MAKFSTHTFVHDGMMSHSFGPGDDLPEWAEGLVGAHVLMEPVAPAAPAGADNGGGNVDGEQANEEPPEESDGETKVEPENDKPTAKSKGAAAPDFTAAATSGRRSGK